MGDTIEKVTQATGIDKAVKAIAGDDCGCKERRDLLNRIFPYGSYMNPDDRTTWEQEFTGWEDWSTVPLEKQKKLVEIYNRSARGKRKLTRCGKCVKDLLRDTETLYQNSCEEK